MQRQALFCLFLLFLVIPTLQVCGTTTCGTGGSCADASVCATCGTFAGLQSYFYTSDSLCYVNCPAQSYKDSGQGKCFPCSNTCNGCSGSNINCITCAATNFRVIGSSQCTSTCGDGFYGDSNTIYCTACPQGCSLCSKPSSVECSACTSVAGTQYYRSSISCVAICPPGTYGGISGSAPTCINCGGNCATCNGSATFCLTCITGKKLVKGQNTCADNCPDGQYNPGSNICALCSSNCATCSNFTTCLTCGISGGLQTYLHSNNYCYATCPNGFYGGTSSSQKVCITCASSCNGCSLTATNCLACASAYFRQIGLNSCTQNCGSGYYGDSSTSLCTACPVGCSGCSKSGSTITCPGCQSVAGVTYYSLNSVSCVSLCPSNQYGDNFNNQCTNCHGSCLTCYGGALNNCITCPANKYLGYNLGTCYASCPDGSYAPSSSYYCLPCNVNCKTCSSNSTNCLSCGMSVNGIKLYLLDSTNTCVSSCPTTEYGNNSTNTCDPCEGSCQTCKGPNAGDCITCISGSLNSTGYCVSSCGDGKYSSSGVCYNCAAQCSTCNSATSCTACRVVLGIPYYLQSNISSCLVNCPSGSYADSTHTQCRACTSSCATCVNSDAYCLSCVASKYLVFGENNCADSCPGGQYVLTGTYSCGLCSINCKTCSGGNSSYCTSCGLASNGLHLFLYSDNQCYSLCPSGYYGNTSNYQCTACDGTCDGCSLSSTNCIKCASNKFRLVGSNACGTCPAGYYGHNTTKLCTICPTGCTTCTSPTACAACTPIAGINYYLLNGSCLQICPYGMYGDTSGSTPVCTNCSSSCVSCTSASVCLSCASGNVLRYGTSVCASTCLDASYNGGSGFCLACEIYCKTCVTSATNCLTCNSLGGVGYYLNNNKCSASCPINYYAEASNLTCLGCAVGCQKCTGSSSNQCTSCKADSSTNYYLRYGTTTCSQTCPDGQYNVSTTFQCLLCASSCLTCSGSSNNCLTCGFSSLFGVDLFFSNNKCLLSCPLGYYGRVSDHTCQICVTGCATCYNSTSNDCYSCANISGTIYYKYNGANTCDTVCPSGQYISLSVPFLCQLCSPSCITCSVTAENCTNTNCSINYYYLNNSCLSVCPSGYYTDLSQRQCIACATGCKTCFHSGSNSCYSCLTLANNTSYYLNGVSSCSTFCGSGFYQNSTSNLCLACVAACATCTSPTTCQSCQSVNGVAYFLSSNSCIILCPSGEYGLVSNFSCVACADGCNACFGATLSNCYNCTNSISVTPYFLQYGTTKCSSSCPNNQYKNTISYTCLLCSPSCLTCQNISTTCLTCGLSTTGVTLYFFNYKCLAVCPTAYWPNSNTNTCDPCTTGCLRCTNSGLNACNQCTNHSSTIYYLYIGSTTCNTSCPDGQFISSSVPNYCQPCSSICVTCSLSAQNCTSSSCAQNYYFLNNSCLADCPNNYFNNLALRQCTQCTAGCQTCYSSGLNSCIACQTLANGTKYYLQIGLNTCNLNCNLGQFKNTTTLKCVACRSACKTCTDSSTCQSCQSVDGLPYFLTSNTCSVVCPIGNYGQISNYECTSCFAGCRTCFASTQSDCYSCKNNGTANYYLTYGTNICNLTCPDGSYQNATSFLCLLCSPLCKTCTINATYCTSCGLSAGGQTLFLENGTCIINCLNGFYEESSNNLCTACNPACRTCNDATTNYCFSCGNVTSGVTTQYYLYVGATVCNTTCPLGQFISAMFPNNCQMCDSNCVGCSGSATICSQDSGCKANLFYNNATNSCVLVCPDGTFANTVTKFCQNCTNQCALCYGSVASKCTKCKAVNSLNYFRQINKDLCIANCASGEYGDASTLLCQLCSPACAICTNSALNCSSCRSVNGIGYFLQATNCIISCPVGKYGRISDFTCVGCATGCASCTGPAVTDCQSCKNQVNNYYLVFNTNWCNSSCPNGQYSNSTSFRCMLCSSQCLTCVNSSKNCLSCGFSQYGFHLFLHNNQCLQNCPNQFWPNTTANTCDPCNAACLLCTYSNLNSCTSCGNISATIYYKHTKANKCATICPDGEYISASIPNLCQVCSINCVTCSITAQNCTSSTCAANYFFLNNSCLTSCPDNYYADVSARQCIQCTAGCQSCFSSGLSSCTKCKALANGTQYYLQINQTTCADSCNPGEYPFGLTVQCVACNPLCATCTSYTVCQSCQSLNGVAYYLDSNSCIIKCPSTKFGQLSNFTCLACSTQCSSCFGGTSDKCYSCNAGFFLIYGDTLCNATCSNGTYANSSSRQCLLCAPQCLTCITNASNCLSCGFSSIGSNLYLHNNQCLLNCPVQYWANPINHNCDSCHASCLSCTSSGQNSCQSCGNITVTIYYKYIGADTCNTTCPNGQFISASIPNVCQPCSPICITCVNSSEVCTNLNCSQNYFYLNNSCLSTCPDNYYPDTSLRQCIQCTAGCQSCFGAALTSCTKCGLVSTTQYYLQIGIYTCAAGCNPGEYSSSLSKSCAKCNSVCALCTSASVCQSCQTLYGVAYFLSNNSCIYACPSGQYGSLNDFTCYTCAVGCLTCFAGDAFSCYNCTVANVSSAMTNYFLEYSTTKCQTFCPDGQYKNVTSYKCQLCDQNCKTCVTTSTNCLSCGFSSIGASLYLHQSTCLLSCPQRFFANATAYNCDSCFQGCLICNGPTSQNCTICRTANNSGSLTPYYKYIGSTVCNTSCPTGQLISGKFPNTCQTCDPGCAACSGLSTTCLSCNPGYFFFSGNNSCLRACPNNYYPNTTTGNCTQCTAGCALCYGTGLTYCTKCQVTVSSVPYFKVIDIDICNTTCPAGQYPYQLLLACQYCSAPCLTCNTSAIDCQSCTNVSGVPYFNLNNQCLLNCPDGYYGQLSNNSCVQCVTGCALCFGGNNVSCTQCKTVIEVIYYLVYGSTNCSLSCPAGQYRVDYLNTCNLCDTNCFTCDVSSTNCTSCFLTSTGIRLYLQNNLCVQSCKTGSYQNSTDNTCYSCNIGCLVCTGPSLFQCQACRDAVDPSNASHTLSYYLNIGNTICSLVCPVGQFKRAGYPNACQPCSVQCIGCSISSTNCTQGYLCTLGYYFYRVTNSCLTACPAGYYANSTTRYCQVCAGGCSLCKAGNLNNCQQCKQDNSTAVNYYKQIYMDSCVATCLDGQYSVPSDFSCQPCHASCILCNITSTACQRCKNVSGVNYFYYANGCLLNCPNGYYGQKSNNTCVVCNPACPLCFGPSTTQCYSCQPDASATPTNYYYLSYGTTYCVTTCPYGQYALNSSFTCQYCNINCATCSGSATNCLTCTYINTINIVYLYQNKCVVTCPGGLWQNSTAPLDHQCSPCHSYCNLCTGPTNTACTACSNLTSPFTMYYKDRYSTTCNPTCPVGQYIDAIIPNLCVPCDFKCLSCNVSSTNCFKCALGYFLYVPLNSCTAMCPPGYFNDPTVTSNNYYCSTCTPGCLTCNGPTLNNCQTCENITLSNGTLVSYFKDVTGSFCVTVCSIGYYGNILNNNCDACQVGCVSCQYNKSYCYSCKSEGGNDYFKPKATNSCVTVCPNGYYGNATDYTCRDCIYYTYDGSCVLSCPTGYFPQVNNSKTICQDCNDSSAVGNPCNRSYTFTVTTAVVDNGNALQHKVYLPKGLSPNVTAQQLMTNLSVKIQQPSRRRLQQVNSKPVLKSIINKSHIMDQLQQIGIVSIRMLLVSTPLAVRSLRISQDRTVIFIVTDYTAADFSVANVKIDFPSTALVSSDGLLYQSTTASFQLSSPTFQQSLFTVFTQDIKLQIQGIVFILLSLILLVFQLVITNRKGYHQMMSFIMLIQVMGILRIKQFPINFDIYTVLIGFSYFQLFFLPNGLAKIFPPGYIQKSLDPVGFALGSHNTILNLGSIIQVFFFFQLCLFIYYVCRKDKPEHLARMKLYQQTLVVLFMVIIIYNSILAAISLSLNSLTTLSAQFLGSIALAILLLIFYLVYAIVWVRPFKLFEMYKINNMFRVIGLALLPINHYAGLILIDLADLTFIVIDIVLYRGDKINFKAYLIQRIFTLIALNTSIFATSSISLLIVAGLSIMSVFIIKVYYTVLTVKDYIDQKKEVGASEIDVSDVVNASLKAKEQDISSGPFDIKLNQSQNFICNESLDIEKYDQMPSRNKLLDLIPKGSHAMESEEEQQEKKVDEEQPSKQIESQASHEEMIVYLDPEDYKEQTRKKQELKKNLASEIRPTTNQQDRRMRRNMRTDATRTGNGFYPIQKHKQIIEEQVEVIKVHPRAQSEQSSDIVSESSDGAGWLDQNDERNMSRAKNNKLVWKIIQDDSPLKRNKKQ